MDKCAFPGCAQRADPRWFVHGLPACDGHGCVWSTSCRCWEKGIAAAEALGAREERKAILSDVRAMVGQFVLNAKGETDEMLSRREILDAIAAAKKVT